MSNVKKYLIAVDDEDDLRFLFNHYFKKQINDDQLELLFFNSANECVEALESLKGQIVVLSDICMPDMTGIELLQIISQKFPKIQVLLVSAYDREKYIEDMVKWNAVGYISKPVDFGELKEKVFELLDIAHN